MRVYVSYSLWIAAILLMLAALLWAYHLEQGDDWGRVGCYAVAIVGLVASYVSGILAGRRGE
jgi:type IV secretory pathway TrbL component